MVSGTGPHGYTSSAPAPRGCTSSGQPPESHLLRTGSRRTPSPHRPRGCTAPFVHRLTPPLPGAGPPSRTPRENPLPPPHPVRQHGPMSVLTRDEAQTRAQIIDVERYTIALDLTTGEETFDSRAAIRFTARTAGDTFVEIKPATLRSVTLDGQPLDPALLDGNRFPLTGLTPAPTNCTSTPRWATRAPARACTASPTRPTARRTSTPSCSWRTSSASSPPSTSRT